MTYDCNCIYICFGIALNYESTAKFPCLFAFAGLLVYRFYFILLQALILGKWPYGHRNISEIRYQKFTKLIFRVSSELPKTPHLR